MTVDLDNELLATAKEYAGVADTSAVINEALRALIEREAARRLRLLGSASPDSQRTLRRRSVRRHD